MLNFQGKDHKFFEVLEEAMKDKKLHPFQYKNGRFIFQKITPEQWEQYKEGWRKQFEGHLKRLKLRHFETVEPSSSYLEVEIGYDTPHDILRQYFYKRGVNVWEVEYVYK